MALPLRAGSTVAPMRTGAHTVRMQIAAPSSARSIISSTVLELKAPMRVPTTMTPQASAMHLRGPILEHNMPEGMANGTMTRHRMLMSHDAVAALMENCSIKASMMVGTLYCTRAMETPTMRTHSPTLTQF